MEKDGKRERGKGKAFFSHVLGKRLGDADVVAVIDEHTEGGGVLVGVTRRKALVGGVDEGGVACTRVGGKIDQRNRNTNSTANSPHVFFVFSDISLMNHAVTKEWAGDLHARLTLGLAEVRDLLPLLLSGVNAGGVVGASVEHEDGAVLGSLDVGHHAGEVEAEGLLVVVAVGLEGHAGVLGHGNCWGE